MKFIRQNMWIIFHWAKVIPEGSRGQGSKGSSDPPQNRRIKMLKNDKEVKVRQNSYDLCLKIERITAKFPKEERYALSSPLRKSALSIPSHRAER